MAALAPRNDERLALARSLVRKGLDVREAARFAGVDAEALTEDATAPTWPYTSRVRRGRRRPKGFESFCDEKDEAEGADTPPEQTGRIRQPALRRPRTVREVAEAAPAPEKPTAAASRRPRAAAWASAIGSAAGRGDWLLVVERLGWGTVLALAGAAVGFVWGVWGTATVLTPPAWVHLEAALRDWPWRLGAILPLAVAVALVLRGRRWLLLAAQVATVAGAVLVAWGVVR